jgi:hypothetical protein
MRAYEQERFVEAGQRISIRKPTPTEERQQLLGARSVVSAELTLRFFEL